MYICINSVVADLVGDAIGLRTVVTEVVNFAVDDCINTTTKRTTRTEHTHIARKQK